MVEGLTNINQIQTRSLIEQQAIKTNTITDSLKASRYGSEKEMMDACVEFESYFVHFMLKEMRKTTNLGQGLFTKSSAHEIFQDMSDEQIAKKTAETGGIGLASFMYRQMMREKDAGFMTLE